MGKTTLTSEFNHETSRVEIENNRKEGSMNNNLIEIINRAIAATNEIEEAIKIAESDIDNSQYIRAELVQILGLLQKIR